MAHIRIRAFPVFYRVGTGTQYVMDKDGNPVRIAGGYAYKTGGIVNPPFLSTLRFTTNIDNSPLTSWGWQVTVDPAFCLGCTTNKWVVLAVLHAADRKVTGRTNWYTIVPVSYVDNIMKQDADAPVISQRNKGDIHWSYDETTGIGTLTQGASSWSMHGNPGLTSPASLNSGKISPSGRRFCGVGKHR